MAIDQEKGFSFSHIGTSNWVLISILNFSGSALKKELTPVTNCALELPPKNPLRVNLERYKKRIEEYLDEFLGPTFKILKFFKFSRCFQVFIFEHIKQ